MNKSNHSDIAGLPNWQVLGFTGHRHLSEAALIVPKLEDVLDQLLTQYPYLVTLSSAASGADTLFLEAAEQRRLPCHILLPFSFNEFQHDFADLEDWNRAQTQIQRSYALDTLRPCANREEAYLEAGILTVERCDILIAVWNGKPAQGMGGTAEIVEHAIQLKKPLIIIDAITGEFNYEHFQYSFPSLNTDQNALMSTDGISRKTVQDAYNVFSSVADKHAPIARSIATGILLLHLIASAIAIVAIIFHIDGAVTGSVKVLALLIALLLPFVLLHKSHHSWSSTRPSAELCRFYLAIWGLKRIPTELRLAHTPELAQLSRCLSITWLLDKSSELSFENAKADYLKNRIEDQIAYYKDKLAPSILKNTLIVRSSLFFSVLAIVAGILAMNEHSCLYRVSKALSIVLPLVVAALIGYGALHDSPRRSTRYKKMLEQLTQAQKDIHLAKTWPSLWRVVEALEYELLNEIEEWHTLNRFGQSH